MPRKKGHLGGDSSASSDWEGGGAAPEDHATSSRTRVHPSCQRRRDLKALKHTKNESNTRTRKKDKAESRHAEQSQATLSQCAPDILSAAFPEQRTSKKKGRGAASTREKAQQAQQESTRVVMQLVHRLRWDLIESGAIEAGQLDLWVEAEPKPNHQNELAGRDSMDCAERICRRYLRSGSCDRGSSCRYSHAISFASAGVSASTRTSGSVPKLIKYTLAECTERLQRRMHSIAFIMYDGSVLWDRDDQVLPVLLPVLLLPVLFSAAN